MKPHHFLPLALLVFVACENKSATTSNAPAPNASVAATPVPTPTPSAEPPSAATAGNPMIPAAVNAPAAAVPVPQDYEEEAKRAVTADSLDTELDKLEKTIARRP
jgi:hypothetical protein